MLDPGQSASTKTNATSWLAIGPTQTAMGIRSLSKSGARNAPIAAPGSKPPRSTRARHFTPGRRCQDHKAPGRRVRGRGVAAVQHSAPTARTTGANASIGPRLTPGEQPPDYRDAPLPPDIRAPEESSVARGWGWGCGRVKVVAGVTPKTKIIGGLSGKVFPPIIKISGLELSGVGDPR